MQDISLLGILFGAVGWFVVRHGVGGLFTLNQNERAVKTSFGRAERLQQTTLENPMAEHLTADERNRYKYPQVRVILPGGPYFKWPWEKVHRVSIATETVNLAYDPEELSANRNGTELDAVTKDQLNIGLQGQLRFRVSDQNLYAYLFAIKRPLVHVLAYFISVLRQKIAAFDIPDNVNELPPGTIDASEALAARDTVGDLSLAAGVSINDLRKNLRRLNEEMDAACVSSGARYGIVLDASLITEIDPPNEVESALAAINTAHNQVGAEVSLAQASADQKLVQSRRAVEIETLNAQAEIEPLRQMSKQLMEIKKNGGSDVLSAYVRNVKLSLFARARNAILEMKK